MEFLKYKMIRVFAAIRWVYFLGRNLFTGFLPKSNPFGKAFLLLFLLGAMSSCGNDNDPENMIISDNAEEGILFVEHVDSGTSFRIETNNGAKFFTCATKPSFPISEEGQASLTVDQGVYWIDVHWENGNPLIETIPVVISKNSDYARSALITLKNLKSGAGKYALVFRHANASIGVDMPASEIEEWWKSCDPGVARQLNAQGIERSIKIGQILKKLQVPVKAAVSSEFCRAIQTVELMETGVPIELDARLNHENANPITDNYRIVFDALNEHAVNSGLLIAIGHYNMYPQNPYRAIIRPFEMMDAFLVKVDGSGDPELVGSIPYFFWALFED